MNWKIVVLNYILYILNVIFICYIHIMS